MLSRVALALLACTSLVISALPPVPSYGVKKNLGPAPAPRAAPRYAPRPASRPAPAPAPAKPAVKMTSITFKNESPNDFNVRAFTSEYECRFFFVKAHGGTLTVSLNLDDIKKIDTKLNAPGEPTNVLSIDQVREQLTKSGNNTITFSK